MNNSFETYISNYFDSFSTNKVIEAMKYSMEGGKRIRPEIIFSIVKGYGLSEEIAYPSALALEMIQTYSLIHDDLPAMDNDDYRRGKLSCHKAFGEDIAILAGDALLTHSFGIIADSDYNNLTKAKMISYLSSYAGLNGMIYGQYLDVSGEIEKTKDGLKLIQDNKTSGLFKIACLFGGLVADDDNYKFYTQLGSKIGIIFQNQDDLFDVIKSQQETGKSYSKVDQEKFTALSIYSIDELKKKINDDFVSLNEQLNQAKFNVKYLQEILNNIKER